MCSFFFFFLVDGCQVEWLKNDEPLRNIGEKCETLGYSSHLKIHSINFADTGAYMCQASSVGGLARDISSLVVQDDSTPSESSLLPHPHHRLSPVTWPNIKSTLKKLSYITPKTTYFN